MYPDAATANSRCPAAIDGVAQKATSSPSIIGCRTQAYIQRSAKDGELYGLRRAHPPWRRPRKSRWSIMNVELSAVTQPRAQIPHSDATHGSASTRQIEAGRLRHCQNI